MPGLKAKHRRTLEAVFSRPTPTSIRWREVEGLLKALGAELEEREGSRVAVILKKRVHILHKPHPQPELKRGSVRSVRELLEAHEIWPQGENR